jgi:hypothetical protein
MLGWKGLTADPAWRAFDDEALERLLIERWLYRGGMLAVMLGAAVMTTYLGIRGVPTVTDRVMVATLLALALTAGTMAFVMRLADHGIHQELRRRRRGAPK